VRAFVLLDSYARRSLGEFLNHDKKATAPTTMAPPFIKKKMNKSSDSTTSSTGTSDHGDTTDEDRRKGAPASSADETDGLLRRPQEAAYNKEMEVFYVNVTVIDASMAVYDKVRSKLASSKKLPGPQKFRDKLAGAIASQAANNLPAKTIAEKMSQKIPQVLMYKLAEKGLKLHA